LRIQKASETIEEKLMTKDVIGAYTMLRSWYRSYDGKASTPSEEALEKVRSSYEKLYSKDDLEDGLPFDFKYDGDQIMDEVPTNGELGIALSRMRNRKAPGLSGLSVDTLKAWFREAYPEREDVQPDLDCVENWKVVQEIVRECFEKGTAPTAFQLGTLIIIPKDDKGGVRGIGLLESVHKLISAVINLRMNGTIQFCSAVRGFRRHRGCFTAIGEAKLRMQRAACRGGHNLPDFS
jgi:hypothetical protein